MKRKLIVCLMGISLSFSSCLNQLEEDVRSQVTESYLSTASGFNEAVNGSYGSLKTVFTQIEDNGLVSMMTVFGTDVYTNGFDGAFKMYNSYNSELNPREKIVTFNWNNLYTSINTCNAVITRAPQVTGLTDAVKNTRVAEVKFIRALYYFTLVQIWGPVHLTLTETTAVETKASRAPVKDIYDAIISDLDFAIQTLPATQSQYGRTTKPAAENLLASVYLTRATSEAKQPGDYTKAADLAKGVISKYGFKLLDDFGKIFEQGAGEKNAEVIWAIQSNKDVISNGVGNTWHLYFGMKYDDLIGMQRDVANGRPYCRYKPTDFVLNTLFNRQFDSRYEKSFKRTYFCNRPGTYTINGKSVALTASDTAFYVADREWTAAEISRAKYVVYTPSRQNERIFPTLIKHLDPQRLGVNDQPGFRDLLFSRLAETYLIAAEALMMSGNSAEAVTYINTVRRRAAKTGATAAETEANRKAMDVTAGQLTVDFILDERARELLGEGNRWFDLVRTGKLLERVKKYNPVAAANIKDYHVLRPIPQQQIDRTEGEFKQNPGY